LEWAAGHYAHRISRGCDLNSAFVQLAEKRSHVLRIAIGDREIASGERSCEDKGPSLNPVGNNAVSGAAELFNATHANGSRARALDLCSHFAEQGCEIHYLGFAGAVLKNRLTLSQRRCHQQVFRPGNGFLLEHDARSLEALGAGLDVAMLLRDARSQLFQ